MVGPQTLGGGDLGYSIIRCTVGLHGLYVGHGLRVGYDISSNILNVGNEGVIVEMTKGMYLVGWLAHCLYCRITHTLTKGVITDQEPRLYTLLRTENMLHIYTLPGIKLGSLG